MLLVSLLTTLIFYGNYRFTYCVEPFLLPMIAIGLRGRAWAEAEPAENVGQSTEVGVHGQMPG